MIWRREKLLALAWNRNTIHWLINL